MICVFKLALSLQEEVVYALSEAFSVFPLLNIPFEGMFILFFLHHCIFRRIEEI